MGPVIYFRNFYKEMGSDNCGRLTSQSLLPGWSARQVKERNLLIIVIRLFFVAIMDTYLEILFHIHFFKIKFNLTYLTGYSLLVCKFIFGMKLISREYFRVLLCYQNEAYLFQQKGDSLHFCNLGDILCGFLMENQYMLSVL